MVIFILLDAESEEHIVLGTDVAGRLLVRVREGEELLGWQRKPIGWCRGDACIPAWRAADVEHPGDTGSANSVDLAAFAELTGHVLVADRDEHVIAVGEGPDQAAALGSRTAPDVTLPDMSGRQWSLSDLRGRKVALVLWASWCGCRYDLPAWEAKHAELESYGFTMVSVALDPRPEDARPWIEEANVTHPALTDPAGLVAERYNVVNVPTVVWIDEFGRIVRPPDTQVATDTFRSMNGLSSGRALAALRRWVVDGEPGLTDDEVDRHLRLPGRDDQVARVEARLGTWLARNGRGEAAVRHLDRAAELAPYDVTIRRGTMRLRDVDPFGDEYFALREELAAAGIPTYRPLPDWHVPDGRTGATHE